MTAAYYPSPDDLLQALLRAVRFAYKRIGIDRNVLPDSDDYKRLELLTGRVGIAIANNLRAAEDGDPLRATGEPLRRLAAVFGVFPRPAGGSAGAVTASYNTPTLTIPSAFDLTAPNGKKYRATPGTYTTTTIPIVSSGVGKATNQAAGTVLQWDSAAIGALSATATVTAAGVTGGADADDDETLRGRLLERLAAAAGGGNESEVVQWAEDASASVSGAYAYAAAQGPASYDVAVTARGGDRTLPTAIVNAVKAYVKARMPGQQQGTFTTVTPEGVDITIAADLPLPQLSGGAGGGWLDAVPWPKGEDVQVTGFGGDVATLVAATAPTVGASIGVWDASYVDPDDPTLIGRMNSYSINAVALVFGEYLITVQGGFIVSPLDAYISTGAVSLADYARTFADQVALLGPGEKTSLPELLPRAARQPAPDARAPSAITDRLKAVVEDTYGEILDFAYSLRVATGTNTPLTAPSVPGTSADPPNVLVLKQFAIRAA